MLLPLRLRLRSSSTAELPDPYLHNPWYRKSRQVKAALHLASAALPIRCCAGTNQELHQALSKLEAATAIVIDRSALATLLLTRNVALLKKISFPLKISYGTLRNLRQFYLDQRVSKEQGFVLKEGDRFIFRETDITQRRQYVDNIKELVDVLEEVATVEEGRAFASIAKHDRDRIKNVFGRSCGESIALAKAQGHVLWLDDLPLNHLAAGSYQVSTIWTQALASYFFDKELISEGEFYPLSFQLLKATYTSTRVVPNLLYYFGKKASWSTDDSNLASLLAWFSNADIPAQVNTWIASNVILHVMTTVSDQTIGDKFISAILTYIRARFDGQTLLEAFRGQIASEWTTHQIDIQRLDRLISECLQ